MAALKLDLIDRKILEELQNDGRITNVELSRRVGISAPPCLRRVRSLEESGLIEGYHARLNALALGYEVTVFAMVSLRSQAGADLEAFEALCADWPLVRECHMLYGDIDFLLKCVSPNLAMFQTFLTDQLTATPNVANVRTSLEIRATKNEPGVPFEHSEHLAAESV
ncbi:MAG: Lrp/AsnC family transcriptional regulator [Pseudomonadota bacterium]